ncbi:CNNM domain-containing protein [SAR86 cluster bacterium]|nr:CNNM domain-containing protein [SAR86 cluster bacterium]MDC3059634.1 CNNM domain-containing protein [SAR86 cluster bacterium]
MNDLPIWLLLASIFLLLILSAFFSGSETSMMAINRYRLKYLAKEKNRAAIRIEKLLRRPDRLLGIILIGNNFVNILASALTTILFMKLYGDVGVLIGSILLTIVILIFSEVTPKTFAAIKPEPLAFFSSFPLKILQKVLFPLVSVINYFSNFLLRFLGINRTENDGEDVSPEELKAILETSGDLIPTRYQDMLLSILELDKISIEEVMTQRSEIIGIDLSDDFEEILEQLQKNQVDFLPIFDQNLDDLRGMLDLYGITNFLSQDHKDLDNLVEASEDSYFIPENTSLSQQLFNFQKERKRVGIVIDEYGSVKGLLSLEDILGEIVGELAKNNDDSKFEIMEQRDGSFLIDASVPIREINRKLQCDLPLNGPRTLNGLILEQIETIPEANVSITIQNVIIETVLVRNNMIKIARLFKSTEEEDSED